MDPQDTIVISFIIALGLLVLFIWYFASDSERNQRYIGTLLALGLAGFCIYSMSPPEKKIKKGMDLAGGVRFTLELQLPEDVKKDGGEESKKFISRSDQDEAKSVLERRLSASAVSDVSIVPVGKDRLSVDIPHREGGENEQTIDEKTISTIREQLQKSAILNLYLSHEQNSPDAIRRVEKGDFILNSQIVEFDKSTDRGNKDNPSDPDKLLLQDKVLIKGSDVTNALAVLDSAGWVINITFKGDGADELSRVSNKYKGDGRTQMAILLDGKIISAAVFNGHIPGGNCQISGNFTENEAKSLAVSMRNPLGVKPEIVFEESFPPTLAKAAIDQGFNAGLTGIGLTAIFMLIFYRFAGLIALIGLSINIILLFGILAIFQADFTLAGIAGVILTIGIAIDANVLIYERLREEKASGKSIGAAIQSAYEKAFSAIFDAQITTLLTAFVLLWLAEGAIQGFATTLTIGIIVSLFSALLVTRVCYNWLKSSNKFNQLNFTPVLSKKNINFLGLTKITKLVSFGIIILSIIVLGVKRGDSLGIEFAGGQQLRFNASENISTEKIFEVVNDNLSKDAKIPQIQELTPLGQDKTIYSVRVSDADGEKVKNAISSAGLAEGQIQSQQIRSQIAGEMLSTSITALIAGLIAIFIYITFRFEFSFALGAIAALVHDLVIVIGITVLCGLELNLILVGAFLTIAGYSINDTIVVFDRIREGLRNQRGDQNTIMNVAINSTLSRTILTSLTTLLTVISLYLFGGPSLQDFSFAIIIGVIVGTYSSIFVASPIVAFWAKLKGINLRRQILDAEQETVDPTAASD
jgi:SecD/SecF fusion protein